jgi:hypothetical protein
MDKLMQHFIEGVERARDYPYLDAHGVRVPSLDSKRYDGDTSVDKDGNYVVLVAHLQRWVRLDESDKMVFEIPAVKCDPPIITRSQEARQPEEQTNQPVTVLLRLRSE